MKILLHENQLSLRGTTDQVYKYGHYLQTLLGHTSYIAAPANSDLIALPRFQERFNGRVFLYTSTSELEAYIEAEGIDVVYFIKYGTKSHLLNVKARQVVHAVFDCSQPHGDRYCAVSKWLGEKYNVPYVSHIVELPEVDYDFREYLGIPANAIVFGRHGGNDSFDDAVVHKAVYNVARNRPDIYFLFMNTDPFCSPLPNIIHVEGTADQEVKRAFINSCDSMIYGRQRGETFGLAIAEFLYCNKPVICSIYAEERNHIEILKDKGVYFGTESELQYILRNFTRPDVNYSELVQEFSAEIVMKQFNELFLAD